jgi:hypothetical protein
MTSNEITEEEEQKQKELINIIGNRCIKLTNPTIGIYTIKRIYVNNSQVRLIDIDNKLIENTISLSVNSKDYVNYVYEQIINGFYTDYDYDFLKEIIKLENGYIISLIEDKYDKSIQGYIKRMKCKFEKDDYYINFMGYGDYYINIHHLSSFTMEILEQELKIGNYL